MVAFHDSTTNQAEEEMCKFVMVLLILRIGVLPVLHSADSIIRDNRHMVMCARAVILG